MSFTPDMTSRSWCAEREEGEVARRAAEEKERIHTVTADQGLIRNVRTPAGPCAIRENRHHSQSPALSAPPVPSCDETVDSSQLHRSGGRTSELRPQLAQTLVVRDVGVHHALVRLQPLEHLRIESSLHQREHLRSHQLMRRRVEAYPRGSMLLPLLSDLDGPCNHRLAVTLDELIHDALSPREPTSLGHEDARRPGPPPSRSDGRRASLSKARAGRVAA